MYRAAIALGLIVSGLAACTTTPKAKIAPAVTVVEPAPDEPAWRHNATPADQMRVEGLHDLFAKARASVSRRSLALVTSESVLLDPTAAQTLPQLPPGPYYCRLVRFGTRGRVATFKPDFCYVEAGQDALSFTKQTGANLPEGWIFPDRDTRQIFLGTLRREGEAGGKKYGEDPVHDLAGVVERVSPFRWRLILTRAGEGALLDLYELVPVPPPVPGAKPAVPEG